MPSRIGLNLMQPQRVYVQQVQYNLPSFNTTLNQGQQFRGISVGGFSGMNMINRVSAAKPGCGSCGK
jgi:hypothetical protein